MFEAVFEAGLRLSLWSDKNTWIVSFEQSMNVTI